MSSLEDLRPLDAQAAQLVDIEEAPPVDVITGGAPAGQTIMLTLKQLMQTLEAFRFAGVEVRKNLLDSLRNLRILGQFSKFGPGLTCAFIRLRVLRQRREALRHLLQVRLFHCLQ